MRFVRIGPARAAEFSYKLATGQSLGQPINTRELVKRRIARLASLIVGADALVEWGSWLIDQGYRGELECVIAKIFGSEALKEAAKCARDYPSYLDKIMRPSGEAKRTALEIAEAIEALQSRAAEEKYVHSTELRK